MIVPFLDLRIREHELREEIDRAIASVIERSSFILGEELEAFEEEFAAYCGAAHAIGVGTGLDALELALRAVGISAGDEVIVPATTFVATWLAVSRLGAIPVPVEVAAETALLDPERLECAITPRTRCVMPVHLYGIPAAMPRILEIARQHDLRVVVDAAQAHGARVSGYALGHYGDAICYSFYPSKNLGALGDGGAVATDSATIADKIRLLRNYGSRQKYLHLEIGTNSRLDEIQAAILRRKLRYLDAWNKRRQTIAATYERSFSSLGSALHLPRVPSGVQPVWHLYPIRHADRDRLMQRLKEVGIATLVHYPVPPHRQPAYEPHFSANAFQISSAIAATTLSLPIGPYLDDSAVCEVIERVVSFITDTY